MLSFVVVVVVVAVFIESASFFDLSSFPSNYTLRFPL